MRPIASKGVKKGLNFHCFSLKFWYKVNKMGSKLVTFQQLCNNIGVHRSTVRRKLKAHGKEFRINGKRKRFYDEKEQEAVKKIVSS